ncbi:unnamed protein product [Rotaria sp. Silwood1]|nr:unnamed protein product [Rotaria sp. Silwood1]CAF1345471.1 unnamed protein product [Rotaria sp. Silwood1]CAF4644634.1 unnamed protein product [Rotaria sp. Silwood1]
MKDVVQLLDLPDELILAIVNKIKPRLLLLCSIIDIGNNRLEQLALDKCHSIDLTFDYFKSSHKLRFKRSYSHVMSRISNQIQSLTFDILHIRDLANFAEQNCNGTLLNLTHLKITIGRQYHETGTPYTLRLLTFNFTTYITPNLVSQHRFDTEISQIIDQFIKNTTRSFLSSLYLINNMSSSNMLISALSPDSILTLYPQYYHKDQAYNSSLSVINCDCQENPYCIQQSIVYDLDGSTRLFPVPGVYVGCYLVEALLQSNLRCLYDDLCLQELIKPLKLSINSSSLSNSSSVYGTSYEDYFNECQPEECSATYVHRENVVYIITTMTGLISGLTKVYLFTVPLLVNMIFPLLIRLKRNGLFNNRVAQLETIASNADGSV